MYVTNVYVGSPYISKIQKISEYGNETTVKRLPNGTLFGFVRWGSSAGACQFWVSNDGGNTVQLFSNGPKNGDFFNSPIPCATDGQTIYAVATGNRIRGPVEDNVAGDVALYLMEGKADLATVIGWDAFSITRIGSLYYGNESWGDVGNGVGVGSLVYNEGILHIFESTEGKENVSKPYGSPDIVSLRIILQNNLPAYAKGVQEVYSWRSANVSHKGIRVRNESGRFFGWGAVHTMGRIGSDGTVTWGHGFSAQKIATGTYRVTLNEPVQVGGRWLANVEPEAAAPRMCSVQPRTDGTFFDVFLGEGTGSFIDAAFRFTVFVDYQYTRTDWQGDLQ